MYEPLLVAEGKSLSGTDTVAKGGSPWTHFASITTLEFASLTLEDV
jgi:hypothetical protein